MFITSYLMGGLGNQMFQISKAIAEGMKNNIPVFLEQVRLFLWKVTNQPTTPKIFLEI